MLIEDIRDFKVLLVKVALKVLIEATIALKKRWEANSTAAKVAIDDVRILLVCLRSEPLKVLMDAAIP